MNLMYPFISNTKLKTKESKIIQKYNTLCENVNFSYSL